MTSAAPGGPQPGLHAFIVGISAYDRLPDGAAAPLDPRLLGLRRLQSAALSAFNVAKWLEAHSDQLAQPLMSLTCLLVPSQAELDVEPRLAALAGRATLEQFIAGAEAWRTRCAEHPENVALYYFAGHGAQRTDRSHIMLLQDFGEAGSIFGRCVDTRLLIDGMAPAAGYRRMARTQIYFVDACRIRPRLLEQYDRTPSGPIWDPPVDPRDERSTSLFYAVSPGQTAYSRRGVGTFFSEALLDALNGEGAVDTSSDGEPRWAVTTPSLAAVLPDLVAAKAQAARQVQRCRAEQVALSDLRRLPEPPHVDALITVDPETAAASLRVSISDRLNRHIRDIGAPVEPHPHSTPLRSGVYTFVSTVQDAGGARSTGIMSQDVNPRRRHVRLSV